MTKHVKIILFNLKKSTIYFNISKKKLELKKKGIHFFIFLQLMQLPSQLSMQKQALKCVSQMYQSATVNDFVKKLISKKGVLIYVKKVECE